MKMKIENGNLIVADANNAQYTIIKSWNLMKLNRSRLWLEGVATNELLNKMASIVRLPAPIEEERQRLNKVQAAVDEERMKTVPEPLYDYPVKIPLFQHQIKGANMALLAFGLIEPPIREGG